MISLSRDMLMVYSGKEIHYLHNQQRNELEEIKVNRILNNHTLTYLENKLIEKLSQIDLFQNKQIHNSPELWEIQFRK